MRKSNSGIGFMQFIIVLGTINAAIYLTGEYLKRSGKTQKKINNASTIKDISDTLRTIIGLENLCNKTAMIGIDKINYKLWKNNTPIKLSEIRLNGTAFIAKSKPIDHLTISSIELSRFQDSKFTNTQNSAIDKTNLLTGYMYPSLLTVNFGADQKISALPLKIEINLFTDKNGTFINCKPNYHSISSALATRSAYSLSGAGCNSTITNNLFLASLCTDQVDNGDPDTTPHIPDGICDDNKLLAVNSHPNYNTPDWTNKYDQNGRTTLNPPKKVTDTTPFFGTFTHNEEGRCWFNLSATDGNNLPFKIDSSNGTKLSRWNAREIFIMPVVGSPNIMTLGCNAANGWTLSGCVRKSYTKSTSGDADSDITIDSNGNAYCSTNNMMSPHDNIAWSSIREDLQIICVRMEDF